MSCPSARNRRWLAPASLALLVAVSAGACSSPKSTSGDQTASDSAFKSIAAVSLKPGQHVPAPAGDQVLSLSGKIATTNVDGALVLDVATIERLGLVSFELYEPYQKSRLGFQGVPLAKVLDLAGVDASAQEIHMVALDDYVVDLKVTAARTDGVMLATRSGDGALLPVEDGGPTRIVFLDGTPGYENNNDWIWSLATAEAR